MVSPGVTGWLARADDSDALADAILDAVEHRHSLSRTRIGQFVSERFILASPITSASMEPIPEIASPVWDLQLPNLRLRSPMSAGTG